MTATSYFAHESSVIDEPCSIGDGTKIWHFSHVMAGASIGRDCIIGQNVFVASGVRIGDNCKIQNNVSLYTGVELEDNVFCGPSWSSRTSSTREANRPQGRIPEDSDSNGGSSVPRDDPLREHHGAYAFSVPARW